jgi:hypothetical protein
VFSLASVCQVKQKTIFGADLGDFLAELSDIGALLGDIRGQNVWSHPPLCSLEIHCFVYLNFPPLKLSRLKDKAGPVLLIEI